jgi:GlpG protein
MRLIGHIKNKESAEVFSNYLYSLNIDNRVDSEDSKSCELWILDDEKIDAAKTLLEEYRTNPDDIKYRQAAETADEKRKKEKEKEIAYQKNYYDRNRMFSKLNFNFMSVTGILIILSIIVALLSGLGKNDKLVSYLSITEYETKDGYVMWQKNLPEIRKGQIWRLVSPIFLHFGLMHIGFNMLILMRFGNMIEKRKGVLFLLCMIIITGSLSNIGQLLAGAPNFGGMSGVNYGLFGYIWMQSKFNPSSGFRLSRDTVIMLVAWFFICFTGILPIANAAHTVGLGIGIVWGWLAAQVRRT